MNGYELFGWSEAAWHLVDQIGILLGVAMGVSWFAGLLIAAFNRDTLRRWIARNRFPNVGGENDWEYIHGIAFTVSRADVPLWVIDRLKPRWIGLIATEQSRAQAETVSQEARKRGIEILEPVWLNDPDDPADARDKTRALLEALLEKGACAVDVTGGKQPMSLGAFMAAEELGVKSLYVSCQYPQGKIDPATAAIRCLSRPE